MNILNKYEHLFEDDLFDSRLDDIEYEKAISKHLDELEESMENPNYKSEPDIFEKKPEPIIVKEKEKKPLLDDIEIIETNKIKGSNQSNTNEEIKKESKGDINTKPKTDNLTKKHNDFKHKLFVYKPGEIEMKFINNLSSESYIQAGYLNGKNKDVNPMSLATQDHDVKVSIQPSSQVSYVTTEYYHQMNEEKHSEDVWYPNLLNKEYIDLIGEINNALNSHHSFLTYHDFKSVLISKYPNLIDEINYFVQQPTDKTPTKTGDWFAKFVDSYTMFYKYQLARSHINDNKVLEVKNTTLNKSKLKRNFNVMVLPKDVIEMIRHINYYFKDIKNKLVFDDVTGFYLMDVETEDGKKTKLPIMCRHIFMTLSGKSLYQISKECCVNGQCKYCGDSMISFADDDATNIPPSIAELAYRLIECSDSADDDGTFLVIYNIFTSVIYSFVQQEDPNYDNKATAIVSLYVYKVLNELIRKNIINKTVPNVKKLIAIIADNCSAVGWDEEKMEKLLQNDKLFNNIDLFVKLLSGNQDKILDLGDNMNKIFITESIEAIKELEKEHRLFEFNTINEISILDDVNFDFIQNIIDEDKKEPKITEKPSEIYSTATDTFELFDKIALKYCPVNYIHEFSKDVCKYCGLKKDKSNVKTIYEKYEREFNQKFELDPINKLHKFKRFTQDIDPIKTGLETIKESDIKTYIKTALNLNEDEYKKVHNYSFEIINDIVSVISNYTFTTPDKIWKLKMDEILRIYLYLDKIKIATNLMEIFRYALLPPATYIKTKDKNTLFEDDE